MWWEGWVVVYEMLWWWSRTARLRTSNAARPVSVRSNWSLTAQPAARFLPSGRRRSLAKSKLFTARLLLIIHNFPRLCCCPPPSSAVDCRWLTARRKGVYSRARCKPHMYVRCTVLYDHWISNYRATTPSTTTRLPTSAVEVRPALSITTPAAPGIQPGDIGLHDIESTSRPVARYMYLSRFVGGPKPTILPLTECCVSDDGREAPLPILQ